MRLVKSPVVHFVAICSVIVVALAMSGCGGGSSAAPNTGGGSQVTAPTVTTATPSNSGTGVAVNSAITVTFSKAMDPATINITTFTVTGPGGAAVAGTVSSSGSTATFTPSANLAYSTQYTVTITTGAKDTGGNALASAFTFSFTTAQAPVAALAVSGTSPANGDTGVAVNAPITATFNQAVNASSINATTFTLTGPGNAAVTGAVSYDSTSKTATFTPAGALGYSTSYTATITTGATSVAGPALASAFTWSFTTGAVPANMATLNFGDVKQTIRGFGGATAWLPVFPQNGVNALFGTGNNEIGVSMLRMRIDPTPANWVTERTNAQAALAVAPDLVLTAAPWTPPAQWKLTSTTQPFSATCDTTAGSCGGFLDPTHYGDMATHLESFVTSMAQFGLNIYAISVQNEPDIAATYESCLWTADQLDAFVKNNRSTITTKLMMPESYSFDTTLSDTALNDASAVGNIDIVAGHLYQKGQAPDAPGTQPFLYTNAFNKGKEVWMTEHYVPVAVAGGQPTITDALAAAKEIHDSLTVANYSAYVWWWIVDWSSTINYGLVDTTYNPTFYGYAMGQYSRFIRPGYVRVGTTDHPSPNVYVSAYKGNGHSVIVAINLGTTAVSQAFTVQNQTVTTLTPYQTTGTAKLAPQSAVSVIDGTFTYSLPAQSITTFVQ